MSYGVSSEIRNEGSVFSVQSTGRIQLKISRMARQKNSILFSDSQFDSTLTMVLNRVAVVRGHDKLPNLL